MIDNDRVRNHVFDGYEWKNVNNFLFSKNRQPLYALQCTFIICNAALRQLDLLQVNCLLFK